jgi:gas vesicle protein
MIEPTQDSLNYHFVVGLLAGTAIGAGLLLWFAPQTRSELRQRLADSAEDLKAQAAAAYREVNIQVTDAVNAQRPS